MGIKPSVPSLLLSSVVANQLLIPGPSLPSLRKLRRELLVTVARTSSGVALSPRLIRSDTASIILVYAAPVFPLWNNNLYHSMSAVIGPLSSPAKSAALLAIPALIASMMSEKRIATISPVLGLSITMGIPLASSISSISRREAKKKSLCLEANCTP